MGVQKLNILLLILLIGSCLAIDAENTIFDTNKKNKRQWGGDNGGIWPKNNPIRQWGRRPNPWLIYNQQVRNSYYGGLYDYRYNWLPAAFYRK
jgi:hypothetical protein